MVWIGALPFAAATIFTGEVTVAPLAGEQIFTPTALAVHEVVEEATVTVALALFVVSALLVAVTWWVPLLAGAV